MAGFNPRTRTGCDQSRVPAARATAVSTHAPARGATLHILREDANEFVSTHAPARGATV